MDLKKKLSVAAGAMLLTGALLTGAAFAEGDASSAAARQDKVEQAVKEGKLTQGEADTLKQLGELRRSYMERYKADAKALVDRAMTDGKLTKEQAERMLQRKGHFGHGHGKGHMKHGKAISEEQLKSKLEAAVKEGKLTQEKADAILKKYQEHKAKAKQ